MANSPNSKDRPQQILGKMNKLCGFKNLARTIACKAKPIPNAD
jgi:hypothetical protein